MYHVFKDSGRGGGVCFQYDEMTLYIESIWYKSYGSKSSFM